MQVLVDTSIWSIALRRKALPTTLQLYHQELIDLIADCRVAIIGVIRQEILSGIQSVQQFVKLKSRLSAFPDLPLETADFEYAAELYNHCRSSGIQGSHIDFLITAVAINRDIPVFTHDRDFENYAKYTKLKLHQI